MIHVVDTDVAIDYLKGKPNVTEKVESLQVVAVTAVTAAELFYGACNSDRPEKKESDVAKFLNSMEILNVDYLTARMFGKIKTEMRMKGKTVGDFDLLIAACCMINGCTLLTRNARHYIEIKGLSMEVM